MDTTKVALVLLTAGLVLYEPAAMARKIPGHISRAFSMNARTLPSVEQFCSARDGACIREPVRIGGWNLQRFGISKMDKPEVVDVIVEVIQKYDLIVLQEVTDASQTSIPKLITKLNEGRSVQDQYTAKSSPRIGKTSYKEQYIFVYKPARISFLNGYQYNDSLDIFQIEPYVAQFNSTNMGPLGTFAVIPLHAKPSDAVNELDALVDVYDDMVQRLGLTDAILLGDFNAGCNYVVQGEYEMMRLYTDQRFHWLISDHVDTTTRTTSCPYDRIIVAGSTMQQAAYTKTASTYYFDEELGIESNWDLVKSVSDHYPVEVMIRGTVPDSVLQAYSSVQVGPDESDLGKIRMSLSVELPRVELWSQVLALVEGVRQITTDPTVMVMSEIALVEWSAASLDAAVATVIQLVQNYPQQVTEQAVSVLAYKAGHNVLNDYTLYAPEAEAVDVVISLLCRKLGVHGFCTLSLSAGTGIN